MIAPLMFDRFGEVSMMRKLGAACLVLGALIAGKDASAAEITVLTAGAFKSVVMAIVPEFETQSGHKVTVANDTAGALAKRIADDERFDVVILTPPAIDQLAESGRLARFSPVRLARVGIGVAVKDGAKLPDISTVAAFETALREARSVAYIDPAAGGSSGIYLAQLFAKMGLADIIKAKAVLVPGGLVAERVATGEAELGIHQISEILPVKGITLVGPLPAEIQNYTVYAAGLGANAKEAEAAKALLKALSGTAAAAVLKAKGMEPAGS
jgi:molybdate transport system substrate-binding protein